MKSLTACPRLLNLWIVPFTRYITNQRISYKVTDCLSIWSYPADSVIHSLNNSGQTLKSEIKRLGFVFFLQSSGSQTSEQNLMFADWAAELLHSAPDPDTTARYVSSMVDVSIGLWDFTLAHSSKICLTVQLIRLKGNYLNIYQVIPYALSLKSAG